MSLWVKICGNTCCADARLAVEAGADALGFVFAPSPRQITVDEAAAIVAGLPAEVDKIGVFVGGDVEQIASVVHECGLSGAQLHFAAPLRLTADLRARVGREKKILRVLHFGSVAVPAAELLRDSNADAVLVDARSAKGAGGTGERFDWIEASRTVFREAADLGAKLIVAGGLSPENVAEAIQVLRPWGVDVVTGVEAAPGLKDAAKMRAFVERARAAGDGCRP